MGNNPVGNLVSVDYIHGLGIAQLVELLIPGSEEEDTEALRNRYFDSLNDIAFGGNIADYKQKTKAIDGVAGVKVYPVWAGGGTVKLVIIANDYVKPSIELVAHVQELIDPPPQGAGLGIAPIGHMVTVGGVANTAINLTFKLTCKSGITWDMVKDRITEATENYYLELRSDWENQEATVVRVSQIENRILDVNGIIDIENLKINGNAKNLVLGADNIPVGGTINAN